MQANVPLMLLGAPHQLTMTILLLTRYNGVSVSVCHLRTRQQLMVQLSKNKLMASGRARITSSASVLLIAWAKETGQNHRHSTSPRLASPSPSSSLLSSGRGSVRVELFFAGMRLLLQSRVQQSIGSGSNVRAKVAPLPLGLTLKNSLRGRRVGHWHSTSRLP